MNDIEPTLYEHVGGQAFFEALVTEFYRGVAADALLAPLYPEAPDFDPAKERLALFLAQYWGGPTTYMERRGHPRLRMRHAPFTVGAAERDHWLMHMAAAVEAVSPDEATRERLMAYFVPAAEHLRNS